MPLPKPTAPTWAAAGRTITQVFEHAATCSNNITLCTRSLRGPMEDCLSRADGTPVRMAQLVSAVLGKHGSIRMLVWAQPEANSLPAELLPFIDSVNIESPTPLPGELKIGFSRTVEHLDKVACFVHSHPPRQPGPHSLFVQNPFTHFPSVNSPCPPFKLHLGSQARHISPPFMELVDNFFNVIATAVCTGKPGAIFDPAELCS